MSYLGILQVVLASRRRRVASGRGRSIVNIIGKLLGSKQRRSPFSDRIRSGSGQRALAAPAIERDLAREAFAGRSLCEFDYEYYVSLSRQR